MTEAPESLDDIDPEIRETYNKLGIPIEEQMALAGIAVDAVFDSVSVATTFREKLAESGVIFSSISEAVQDHPELVKEYLGSVVSYRDNFLPVSTLLSLVMAPLFTFPRVLSAPWNYRLIFVSTKEIPGNLNVPSSLLKMKAMSVT